jgi:iron complex transport system substrate-binding protein
MMRGELRSVRLILLLCLAISAIAAPQRIVSTGPSITEILFALGLGPRVVGVTDYCAYPPEAKKIRRIGTWMTPNMEAILETRPDLVIVQKTGIHDDARFKAMRLQTLLVHLDSLDGITKSIAAIGSATGTQAKAAQLTSSIHRELDAVRKRVAGRPPTRVMFVVGRTPGSLEGLITAGSRSYLTEVMAVAGGRNIFEDSPVAYAKVLHEEVLARNPEVIIDMGEHPDATGLTEAQKASEVALWSRYPSLPAVKNHRVHIVSSDLYVHPGPRVIDLARELARLFHPELYR